MAPLEVFVPLNITATVEAKVLNVSHHTIYGTLANSSCGLNGVEL